MTTETTAPAKTLPAAGSQSAALDLKDRARVFDLADADLAAGKELWAVFEPHARRISETVWEQWSRFYGNERFLKVDYEQVIEAGIAYQRNRLTDPVGKSWVESAERTVAGAFAAGVSLTAILSMTQAAGRLMFQSLGAAAAERKDAGPNLFDLLFRFRSFECDVYATLYNAYFEYDARAKRDELAIDFRDGIAALVKETSTDGGALRGQAQDASQDNTHRQIGRAS